MIQFFSQNLLFTEGIYILLATVGVMVLGIFLWRPLFYVSLLFLLFTLYFFRNPDRVCPAAIEDSSVIVAPADGRVIEIAQVSDEGEEYSQKLSIFLSIWDVHVNRTTIAGLIESVHYTPGTFVFAYRPKSSEENERNDIVIKRSDGKFAKVRQIAGTIARKISCWVRSGDAVLIGQRIGMIRFGSRVDLFLPAKVNFAVEVGDQVYGGQTVIGYMN